MYFVMMETVIGYKEQIMVLRLNYRVLFGALGTGLFRVDVLHEQYER